MNLDLTPKQATWLVNALSFVSNKFLDDGSCDEIITKLKKLL